LSLEPLSETPVPEMPAGQLLTAFFGPCNIPVFPYPEESLVWLPLPSSNFHHAERAEVMSAASGGVGAVTRLLTLQTMVVDAVIPEPVPETMML